MQPIDIMNPDGTMNDFAGADLGGLDRFKARKVAVDKLTEIGALEKEEPYTNNVGFSERADVPIEPRLSEQWFLKYPSVPKSKDCVATGAMRFYPERWAKVYDHWMTGIQDWCISRQLWWGHRVPVWRPAKSAYDGWADWNLPFGINQLKPTTDLQSSEGIECSLSKQPGHTTVFQTYGLLDRGWDLRESDVFAATLSPLEARELEARGFTQDPDVLDTWFSSWLWPFATMGWPASTDTLKKFYPTTDLVTGPDIIFFWVARMIMAGYEYMGEMPFRNVYFTGIIRDKQGRKMSKSLGNSPDPLDLIGKYGADALRFGIMRSAPQGQDLLFDEQSVELGRNFCNKLWNACRFRQIQGGESEGEISTSRLTSDDKWILLKLDAAIREVTDALNNYKFNEAANALYRFFWSEYCDWYVESTKAVLDQRSEGGGQKSEENLTPADAALRTRAAERRANTLAVMDFVLSNTLRLFHPFLPFITEELWHGMAFNSDLPKKQGGDTIMFAGPSRSTKT
jgi:valyl-tRNA synthetase